MSNLMPNLSKFLSRSICGEENLATNLSTQHIKRYVLGKGFVSKITATSSCNFRQSPLIKKPCF